MEQEKTFYLTTPIFYPNAKLHLGHAYVMTLADTLARAKRGAGVKTYFLAGSDENTQKMVDAAGKAGKEPLEFLKAIVDNFTNLYKELDISYDQFIRTTDDKKHWPGATMIWNRLAEAGDLYKKEYEGLYCVGHEMFISEKDLIDGKCPDHDTPPERIKEENYFFRLSRFGGAIKAKIESGELKVVPESRKNEILAFIDRGLEDVSFSRPKKRGWPEGLGVPVPGDDSQVMYVWCDALANYVSALGYGTEEDALFKQFWPANVHIIGKDILRFHAAIWPAMLISAGLPLPKTIFAHGIITSGGRKMSKSLGNVIDPQDLIEKYGTDAVRYYLLRHVSPFEDGDLTHESFHDAYTANLANGLGNLVARTMTLAEEHLPHPVELTEEDEKLDAVFAEKIENFRFNEAMDLVFAMIGEADGIMTERAPYKGIKSGDAVEREAARKDIEELVRRLAKISAHLAPALPRTSAAISSAVRKNHKPDNLFPRIA